MKKFFIALLIIVAFGYISLRIIFPSGSWNYRITVEIDTPEGVKTGSAVRRIFTQKDVWLGNGSPYKYSVSGEAVVIDLGERGVVFALVRWDAAEEFFNAFPKNFADFRDYKRKIRYYKSMKSGTKAELKKDLPRLVTFEDINEPISIKEVYDDNVRILNERETAYERKTVDNFEKFFGDGVSFKRVIIEKTNDRVTRGIVEKYLPWLNKYYGKRFDGNRYGSIKAKNRVANSYSAGAFKTDKEK